MIPGTIPRATRALRIAAFVAIACSAPQSAHTQSCAHNVVLNAGTVIVVRLDQALSSKESNKGDKFTATVKENTGQTDLYALPSGTQIEGIIRLARPKKDKDPV